MTELGPLWETLAKEQDALRGARRHRARVAARLAEYPTKSTPRRHYVAYAAAALVLGVAIVVGFRVLGAERELVAHVAGSGESAPLGVWLGAPETRELALEFSDGTRVSLAPKSQLRVASLSPKGAALELKQGKASLSVEPARGARWSLTAGPFGILVTGTRFDVNWQPGADLLEVVLHQGRVELTGCGFGAGRPLVAGQVARARCRGALVAIAYGKDAAREALAPAPAPRTNTAGARGLGPEQPRELEPPEAGSAAADAPATKGASSSEREVAKEPSATPAIAATSERSPALAWQVLAERGEYKAAFEAAERTGFQRVQNAAGPEELVLLGEVARHAGAPAHSERAFRALRQRFGGTKQAAFAAFALGRLQFDAFGSYRAAAEWFRIYLKEQPAGAFAREALGRLLEASHRVSDHSQSEKIARRYLTLYPRGPHADLATSIVRDR